MSLEGTLEVAVGTRVEFTFTVTNVGQDTVDLEFSSGQAADFAVYENDTEVWRWSDGRMFTQALGSERLRPEEAATYNGRWADPQPGTWTAIATLEAANASVEAAMSFEV